MATGDMTRLSLLGSVRVQLSNGDLAEFPTQKAQALLGMLALANANGIDRDEIAGLLWSRSPQSQARTNLRQALAGLRKALGPDAACIKSTGPRICLNEQAISLDVDALRDGSLSLESLLQVSTLMAGINISESPFESWLAAERTAVAESLKTALSNRAEQALTEEDYQLALRLARRMSQLDEFHEGAYRLEMRALQGCGEIAAALTVYGKLKDVLLRDLAVSPSAETEKLRQELLGKAPPETPATSPPGTTAAPVLSQEPRPAANRTGEKPTIAVRPFANLSGDPSQDYLSQGFTEDLITELSRLTLVSVSTLRGEDIEQAAKRGYNHLKRDFDIHFVLEGTVRRAGGRVRITAQMIEAEGGKHTWGERYDRDLEDIFEVLTGVAQNIASMIPGRVMQAVVGRTSQRPPTDIKAYEFYLQGRSLRDTFSVEATVAARDYFRKAIAADDRYAKAYGLLSDTYFVDTMLGLETDETAQLCYDLCKQAIELDASDVMLQEGMGFAYIAKGQWEDASIQFDRAIALIRHEAEQLLWCGYGLTMCGRHEEAVQIVERALAMDPLHPPSFEWVYGQTLFFAGLADKASIILRGEALLNSVALACLVGAQVETGSSAAAQATLTAFVDARRQEFHSRGRPIDADTVEQLAGGYRAMLSKSEDWDRLASGLRKAGLAG